MEIEWALALANFILHAHDLEMVRRFDALVRPHELLGGLADVRRAHHVGHELRVRPLVLLLAVLHDLHSDPIRARQLFPSSPQAGAIRWPFDWNCLHPSSPR